MSENHPVLLGWRICLVISTLPLIYSDRIKKNVDYEVNINIFNCSANSLLSLERKEYTKYLCVLIYSKWSRTWQISFISSRISKSLSILSGLRNFVPQTVLLNLHLSLFKLTCPTGLQSEAKLPIQSSLEKVLIMQNVLVLYLLSTFQTFFLVIWSILKQCVLLCIICQRSSTSQHFRII